MLSQLDEAIDALGSLDLDTLSDLELHDLTVGMETRCYYSVGMTPSCCIMPSWS
jgi:hypothetical protein